MAASKVQLTGGAFQDVLGNAIANGYLTFELSQDAQVTGASPEIIIAAGKVVKVLLDSSGNVVTSPPQYIWPNDVLTPANTFYIVRAFTAQGQPVWGPNSQQVFSSPSPYDIGAWQPNISNVAAPIVQTVYNVAMFYPGAYFNSQVLLLLKLDRSVIFSSALVPSTAVCQVNPTSNATLVLNKNGAQFGTLSFNTSGLGSYTSGGTTFSAGDVLEVVAPGTADATLAGIGMILSGVVA